MSLPKDLADVLANPPRAFSPVALWWWSGDRLDNRRLRWQLERFAAGGVHNLVVTNLAPSGPNFGGDADDPVFFSDEWWETLDRACDDAAELGVSLWFYDQIGFSGADLQARLVEQEPEFAGRWLARDGRVTTHGFDYLSPDACAALLDRVHGEFERRLGHRLGTVIVGSFQDELPALPTWSATFAAEFARRRGYELAGRESELWQPGGDLLRRDYHLTRAELAETAFFRPLAEWHARHGLLSGCDQQDPARAGHPVEGVALYADYARTHRWFSAPGSDHHGDARIHSSLAHLYGHPRTWIEAFHSSGWGGTLEETFDWLLPWLRAGATLYDPHATYYSTRAGWWEWAPPSTDWRQPYWPHYRVFADAVTRLCAALSLGRHVCDVAVLIPTTTVQTGSPVPEPAVDPAAADGPAARAQRVYLDLVGDMTWFRSVPGALDRLRREADVIDDDSLALADVSGGRVRVADESYRVVVLPACTVLDARVADRLDGFVSAGGLLVAVEALPERSSGDGDALARLLAHFAAGRAHLIPCADDLGPLLAAVPPPVEAPVPSLVRDVDGTRLVFLTAAARASDVSVGEPDRRGISLGWLDARYEFDPARYRDSYAVRVRDVPPTAVLVDPFTGAARALDCVRAGDSVEVRVPFDHGPAALLAFPPAALAPAPERTPALEHRIDLGTRWNFELVSTMDNTWGDFDRPAGGATGPQRWAVRCRTGDEETAAHATFGPKALVVDPSGGVRTLEWSTSRGIRKDPIHRETLGPKGHVPEEFLALGVVPAGTPVTVRCDLVVADGIDGWLAVGAAAAKTVRLAGTALAFDDEGYLATAPVRLAPGRHPIELTLVPDEDLDLRAYLAVIGDRERFARPEWISAAGPARPGATVVLRTVVTAGTVQVAAREAAVIRLNGVEVGRQGGFEPYAAQETPRVRRYDLTAHLRPGGNDLAVELTEGDVRAAVLVDGPPGSGLRSGRHWTAERDGRPAEVVVRRRQYGDPAALHLWRRPHPLPGAEWLSDEPTDGTAQPVTVLPVTVALPAAVEPREQTLSFDIPPGARSMTLRVHGGFDVAVDGTPVTADGGRVPLDGTARTCDLRVRVCPGHSHGAVLAGPVTFEPGPGEIGLGDWEDVGLAEFSGGVRYRQRLTVDQPPAGPAVLDLGRVRGTAEAVVNGRRLGVRVCAPYTFDATGALRPGGNDVEILVYGTLAPYLDAVSPTHFVSPGQRVSGLFGPVILRW
ncbi:hypothetical protein [Virgisporangium aurantiacum]|uniref:Alpha-L-rhamnosidase n=1 Tax=Virgisporangium aurantiacum TaxID=175570 RepID=A0A8J3Z9R3_9ACTN|nr:hypothetical protein [Virgisporangium aurantiacum]GIJ57428.1 hypothetical protein Vau01_049440 [Virgisporangium aurantiacum]